MKKRRSIGILCTALTLSFLTVLGVSAQALTEAGRELERYDVNGDGKVTVSDVAAILDYLANGCNHEEVVVSGQAANCFEDGLTDGSYCSVCNQTLKEQQVIPAGHRYNEEGNCTQCGLSRTAELDEHGFSYTLSPDGSYYILSSVGRNEDAVVTVPAKYNGLPVTAIGIGAFYECDYISEIILPESITAIGSLAFYGCEGLVTADLPDGVVYIGYAAFKNCRSLERVTIPAGVMDIPYAAFENCESFTELNLPAFVETVGERAFYGCGSLSSIKVGVGLCSFGKEAFGGCTALEKVTISDIAGWCEIDFATYDANPLYYAGTLYLKDAELTALTIPDGVEYIGKNAFRNAASISSLTLPEGVKSVGAHAFAGCSSMSTVSLPESLGRIEESAFSFCNGLTRVTLPNEMTLLGAYAFYNCFSLKTVYMPTELDEIGERTFSGCRSMTRIYLPDTMRRIGPSAFAGCTALSKLSMPEGLEEIGENAFYGCSALKTLSLCDGLTLVGTDAFGGCTALEEVDIETLAGWCTIDFESAKANPMFYAEVLIADDKEASEPIIPRGVTRIGSYAFYAFEMSELDLPKGVTHVGAHAFEKCTNLSEVTIQNGLVSVGDGAFAGCTALSQITLPKSVRSFGDGVFSGCSALEAVTLPLGLTDLPNGTFAYCCGLSSIELPEGILTIGDGAFYGCSALEELDLPAGLASVGKKAFYGCAALNTVTLPDSLLTVGDDAYYGCTGLTAVYITDASSYCEVLFGTLYSNPLHYAGTLYLNGKKVTSLSVPEGTLWVGDYAFAGYKSLTSVTLPSSLLWVGDSAFTGTGIASVYLYDNVKKIGAHAFADCASLSTLRLSANLTDIGGSAFEGCARITKITLPTGLLTVGNNAFFGCKAALISSLPATLVHIGDYAFAGCQPAAQLIISKNVKTLGQGAFEGCTPLTTLLCEFEEKPLGWEDDWNGSGAAVYWLPSWSNEGGSSVVHTPVVLPGRPATCTDSGLTEGLKCSECQAVLKAQEIIPALGGEHSYTNGICVNCGAAEPYSWTLVDGVLTISGTGAIKADSVEEYPWHAQRNEIIEIVVTGNITEIGERAFTGCENLTKVTLGEKVTKLQFDAFSYDYALKEIVFNAPISFVGQGVVYQCNALEKVTLKGQTKSAFMKVATTYAYNDAFEGVETWIADAEPVGESQLIVKGDDWEYIACDEDPSAGLTASAPSGWLTGSDSASWMTGTAPFNGDTFGFYYFSAYLRKTFTVENAAMMKELTMAVIYDENPSIYLNGQLIWSAEGYHDSGYITVDLSDKLSLLKEGENVLCVTFSNVYGGSIFDMALTCSDSASLVDGNGYVVSAGASSTGFIPFGSVNDAANVLDNDPSTVCGSGFDAGVEQSITVTFKGAVKVNSVYVQCKNEGTTSHSDGVTRGTYDIYLINGDTLTKINSSSVLARTNEDGGWTVTLSEGMEATGVKIVITSWQGDAWACVADVLVKGTALS